MERLNRLILIITNRNHLKYQLSVIFFFCLVLSGWNESNAQADEWKIHLQLSANFGYPQNNIGCKVIGEYYAKSNVELALAYDVVYHFRNFGPATRHIEHSIMGSANLVWGDRIDSEDLDLSYIKFLDSRRYKNSFGYTWQRYFNSVQTTQNVGTIHMRFNKTVTQFGQYSSDWNAANTATEHSYNSYAAGGEIIKQSNIQLERYSSYDELGQLVRAKSENRQPQVVDRLRQRSEPIAGESLHVLFA